jgi:putative protein kinase ArgK-like GTPase of G3E family
LARSLLEQGRSVAILAVDPSSPVSGGALLGDRFRIGEAGAGRCFIAPRRRAAAWAASPPQRARWCA